MGKASKLKKIRRAASQLPKLKVASRIAEQVEGSKLIEEGVKTLSNGETVRSDKKYRKVSTVGKPLNHNRQMKKAYYKGGLSAAQHYINAVFAHAEKQKEEQQQKEAV